MSKKKNLYDIARVQNDQIVEVKLSSKQFELFFQLPFTW